MDRATRKEDVERAYQLQAKAGLAGATRATVLGIGLAVLGHYTWPTFRSVHSSLSVKQLSPSRRWSTRHVSRRQTLPFKGFLVSICVSDDVRAP